MNEILEFINAIAIVMLMDQVFKRRPIPVVQRVEIRALRRPFDIISTLQRNDSISKLRSQEIRGKGGSVARCSILLLPASCKIRSQFCLQLRDDRISQESNITRGCQCSPKVFRILNFVHEIGANNVNFGMNQDK